MKLLLIVFFILFFSDGLVSSDLKSIHVLVALCDNEHQGIVPVPDILGNGSEPNTNLYWGALYGVKSFFKNSSKWKLIYLKKNISDLIVERIVFKHSASNTFLIADAYLGHKINDAIIDIIHSAIGDKKETLKIEFEANEQALGLYGNSDLITYVGHNGLMEFNYGYLAKQKDDKIRDIIVLACDSKSYFSQYLKQAKTNPILLTTGLMAPEAYTLESAFEGWINLESKDEIELRGAKAYSKYQKCSLKAARNLFETKW